MVDRRGLEAMACRHQTEGLCWMATPPKAPPPMALRERDQRDEDARAHTAGTKTGTRA